MTLFYKLIDIVEEKKELTEIDFPGGFFESEIGNDTYLQSLTMIKTYLLKRNVKIEEKIKSSYNREKKSKISSTGTSNISL